MSIKDIRLHDCFGIADVDDGLIANRLTNQNQLIPNVPALYNQQAVDSALYNICIKKTLKSF